MPITVDTNLGRNLTIFKATGMLEFEEVILVLRDFYSDEPTANVLVDLSKLPTVQVSAKEIQALAVFQPRFEGKRVPGKTAILAPSELMFGLAKMFEAQSGIQNAPHSVRVFKSIASAISWIEGT